MKNLILILVLNAAFFSAHADTELLKDTEVYYNSAQSQNADQLHIRGVAARMIWNKLEVSYQDPITRLILKDFKFAKGIECQQLRHDYLCSVKITSEGIQF